MNKSEDKGRNFNRRDFLSGGSVATLMTMLGGVELFAQTKTAPAEIKFSGPKVKVAVIGLGAWGREIISTLACMPEVEVAAICDTYPPYLRRSARAVPAAAQTQDYKTLLSNKDIKALIIATPTHRHKDIAVAALKAGKHVYCEAPLANTMDDARAIALAAKAAPQLVFQAGFQLRSDPQRHFLLPFIRSGALGKTVMARAQYHKKQSWRTPAPTPEREKELNWRLYKATSLGLVGEIGSHQFDQAAWFLDAKPVAVHGLGSLLFWNQDDRDMPDTVQAILEFPKGVFLNYDASLVNSFDGQYEVLYGSDSAVMMRDSKAWLFKEVDSRLLGWEVYAAKETFYKETGIVLRAGASKSVPTEPAPGQTDITTSPLFCALQNFVRNASDLSTAAEQYVENYGDDDPDGLRETLGKVGRRPAAGYLEGFQATVTAIKASEAILARQRIELKPEWYELT